MRDPLLQLLKPRRWPRRLLAVFTLLIVMLCLLPYCLPLSAAGSRDTGLPYANSQLIEADGVDLHCRIWQTTQDGCKGKILLIHGLGGSTYSWEQTAPALVQAGYLVVAADLPAFGFSSRQTGLDHSQRNRARLLWLLLDQIDSRLISCGEQTGWIIAGHSMGGGTAAAMALARPEQTDQLILVDGALSDHRAPATGILMEFPPARRWLALLLEHVLIKEANIERLLTGIHGQVPAPDRLKGYLAPLQVSGTAAALVDFTRTARSEPAVDLNQLDHPILAIWGANDAIIPLDEAFRLQQLIPAMQLRVIPEAGHLPMETHAYEFNQLLLAIIE